MKTEDAETIALQALTWLVGNEDLCPVFLGATGASVDDIKSRTGDPAFLASVLDFLMMDDQNIVAFCDSVGLDYSQPMQALHSLPGQEVPNWT